MQHSAEHVAAFAAALPDDIHPAGRVTINAWLRDAEQALLAGNTAEASRLLRHVNEKIALELNWLAESLGIEDAQAMADVARRASHGDLVGAAARVRELEASHVTA